MTNIQYVKSRVKRGPRLSREGRAEFALIQVNGPRRILKADVIGKLKTEISRLALSRDPRIVSFCERMFERYPELKGGDRA